MAGRIKAIDKSSVHRITSSQVVVDLQTAVKELVENALDAHATSIEVRFKEYGLAAIEVIDNGTGISPEDYEVVALKHHTSKLSKFEDLTTVDTFGFRGEALASLCALCDHVTITTATEDSAPMGTVLQLDRQGRVVDRSGRMARQRGTTVALSGLFMPLPVRRKELERHVKREYGKALNLLSAYALFPSLGKHGIKLSVFHISENGKRQSQIQTDGSNSLRNAISSLWGSKGSENTVALSLDLLVAQDAATLKKRGLPMEELKINVSGIVSKFAVGCGRSSSDRQYFFVNRRPCNLSKVQKAVNEVYKTFNATQSPLLILDFTVPTAACDINVSPDKRTIFVHGEQNLIESLKVALSDHFQSSRSTFSVAELPESNIDRRSLTTKHLEATLAPSSSPERSISSDLIPQTQPNPFPLPQSDSDPIAITEREAPKPNPSKYEDDEILASNHTTFPSTSRQGSAPEAGRHSKLAGTRSRSQSPEAEVVSEKRTVQMVLDTTGASWSMKKTAPRGPKNGVVGQPFRHLSKRASNLGDQPRETNLEVEEEQPLPEIASLKPLTTDSTKVVAGRLVLSSDEEVSIEYTRPQRLKRRRSSAMSTSSDASLKKSTAPNKVISVTLPHPMGSKLGPVEKSGGEEDIVVAEEVVKTSNTVALSISVDIERIANLWGSPTKVSRGEREDGPTSRMDVDSITQSAETNPSNEEELLSRVINKADFGRMEILGQFNLGFIVVRARRMEDSMDDLFIVDQHAADEKYNFETLQMTTRIESQRLLRPRPLELSAADKIVALENLDILQSNGFEVVAQSGSEEVINSDLLLVSQPVSKSTVFDLSDLSELLHLMQDIPKGTMVRCTKARAMFASRACRKSIMIGDPLTIPQMTAVVRHMGTMDQPWNCPHGRPTMRHMYRMDSAKKTLGVKRERRVNWSKLQ